MRKNWKFWLIGAVIVVAVILFVKLSPAWVSVTGVVSFCCGFAAGWLSNVLYNRYKKE